MPTALYTLRWPGAALAGAVPPPPCSHVPRPGSPDDVRRVLEASADRHDSIPVEQTGRAAGRRWLLTGRRGAGAPCEPRTEVVPASHHDYT